MLHPFQGAGRGRRRASIRGVHAIRSKATRFRPRLEGLEERIALATDIWTGLSESLGGNSNWSNPGNWSLNAVPGASDTAVFTSGSQVKATTAVVDTAFSVASVSVDSTWGGNIQVNAGLTVSGAFNVGSGTFGGNGAMSIAAGGTWSGGDLVVGTGGFSESGTLTLSGAANEVLSGGGTFTVHGTLAQTGNASLRIDGTNTTPTTLSLLSGSTYNFKADSGIINGAGVGGVVTSSGTITKTAGSGTSSIQTVLNNISGTLDAEFGTLQLHPAGGNDTNGTFKAGASAMLDLTGGGSINYAGTLTGSGSGTLILDSGTINIGSAGAVFNIPSTLAFRWSGGSIQVPTSSKLIYNGVLSLTGSASEALGGGGMFVETGTILQSGSGSLRIDGTNSTATTLSIPAGSTYNIASNSGILNGGGAGGVVNNAGTIIKTAGTGTSSIQPVFNNANGTLDAESGTLQLDPVGGNDTNGTFKAGPSSAIDLTGNGSINYSGTLTGSGSGSLILDSGTINIGGAGATFSIPSTLTFRWSGGSIQVPTGATLTYVGALSLAGSSTEDLGGGGTFVEKGTILQSGTGGLRLDGTNSTATTLSIPAGSTYNIASNASILNGGGAGGVVNNSGTITKTAGTGISAITTVFNNASGTLDAESGTLQLDPVGGNDTNGTFKAGASSAIDLTGGGSINYAGTLTGAGTGSLILNSGTINIGANSATFNIPSTLAFNWSGGQIVVPAKASLTFSGALNLTGTAPEVLSGGGMFIEKGTINQTGTGGLRLDGTNSTATTLSIPAGSTYNIASNASILDGGGAGGAVDNSGTIIKSAGTGASAITTVLNSAGTLDAESGTLQLDPVGGIDTNGTFKAGTSATLDLTGGGSIHFAGTLTGSGTGTLLLDSGTINIGANGATFNIPSTLGFQWSGGTIAVPAKATLNYNGALTLAGTSPEILTGGGTLAEKGTITQSGSGGLRIDGTSSTASTLNILAGSTYIFGANSGIVQGAGTGGLVNNSGTITKTGGADVSAITTVFNNNGGTLNVSTGTLSLASAGGVINGATFTVATGAVLDPTGGRTVNFTGTLTGSGAGQVQLNSGTFRVVGGSNGVVLNFPTGLFRWNGGTIDTNGSTVTIPATGKVQITGAGGETLTGGGTLNVAGAVTQTGFGSVTITNATTLAINGTYSLQADSGILGGGGGGVVTIGAGGSLLKTAGTAVSTISTSLTNDGTVGTTSGTLTISGPVTQVVGTTLTGGTWTATGTASTQATLSISSAPSLQTIGLSATVTLTGPNAAFTSIAGLTTNQGSFNLLGGESFTTPSSFTNSGKLLLSPGSTLNVGGGFTQTSAGSLTDQIKGTSTGQVVTSTTGTVALAGTFTLSPSTAPSVGTVITLVNNRGSSSITGTFGSLAEGAVITIGGHTYKVSYKGGTGNDVTLTETS